MEPLAAAIRSQRKSLGLTQEELGRFAGCGALYIHDLEKGKPTVRLSKLIEVLKILGLQLKLEAGKSGLEVSGDLHGPT